jgi:tetratricopeptide (TPR) repeat protein
MVLAGRGATEEALRLASEAVDLAAATPQPHLKAKAFEDLADAFEAVGDFESAGPPLREALRLYELKGDVISAERLRPRVRALSSAT